MADKRNAGDEEGDCGTQTTTAGEEAGEEGQDLEKQGDEDEYPAESPHVEVAEGGGAAAVVTAQARRDISGVRVPGPAKRHGSLGAGAIFVVVAADVEVCPLGPGEGAGDAFGMGAQEVRLVEGRGIGDAGEDDEEEEEDGGGQHDQAG